MNHAPIQRPVPDVCGSPFFCVPVQSINQRPLVAGTKPAKNIKKQLHWEL
jgi:hypothetical protein